MPPNKNTVEDPPGPTLSTHAEWHLRGSGARRVCTDLHTNVAARRRAGITNEAMQVGFHA